MRKVIILIVALLLIIGLILRTKQKKSFEETLKEAPVELEIKPTVIATIAIESHGPVEKIPTVIPTETPTPAATATTKRKKVEKEKWFPTLKKQLLAFQAPSTKVFVEGEENHPFGKEKEVLLVTYIKRNGNRSSFRALLDTKTGMILRTWDQTQFEPFKKEKLLVSPTGSLK
ncbi:MAG: hypothetical protein ACOYL6_15635 [Bacteriovoracaceae bacterium]